MPDKKLTDSDIVKALNDKKHKIRTYAKSVGFDVVGKLRYMGKWDRNSRWFMDDKQNIYVLDDVVKSINIIQNKKPVEYPQA